ncbi:M56 family peptidase [Agromyces protaetiae]|uniref:M56 family peptidase n=1 Tax=Agromyces protaetiae TaxID=2509455 RepID=A0A4P6FHX6_9MICO|nr:M56 family metallopeptidase [Agromyces protaetiae]QAY74159.1 M56 family peptidase [Agromyces protaetiae]
MPAVAAALGLLALALAWPVPVALARAAWPSRAPGLALALWQAIALGGGLSMIGCLVVLGTAPDGSILGSAEALLGAFFAGPIPAEFGVIHLAALTLAVGLTVHLALNLGATALRAERERRRQHQLIRILSDPMPGDPGTRLLAHSVPLAYCVPGLRGATVLTDGLLDVLSPDEVRAVIAHEHAHLGQFHHLVLLVFRSWHTALPWFPIANRAERAVSLLTEMLADDQALRDVGRDEIVRALSLMGSAAEPALTAESGGAVPDGDMLAARLGRLEHPAEHPLGAPARWGVMVLAVALITAPLVAMLTIVR